MKTGEYAAKTVDLAIEEGLKDLQTTREKADIEILSAGGFLSKAKVRITVKATGADKAKDFVENVLKLMNVPAYVEIEETESESIINIVGADVSALLARFDTIDALQYLSSLLANNGSEDYKRIVIDCDDYRKARQERLEKLADSMAAKAIERGYRIKLDPMNPYERRVIHAKLQENSEVTTHSEGNEPNRFLVITPKNMKAQEYKPKNYGDKKPFDKNRKPFDKNRRPFDKDRKPFDGDRRPFDKDRKPFDGDRKPFDKDRKPFTRDNDSRSTSQPRPKVATGSIILNPVKPDIETSEE